MGIKDIFACKQCIGIIGGKNNCAYYFIGKSYNGNLLYLDPHTTFEAVNVLTEDSLINNYLVKDIHELSINSMTSAFTAGFMFRNMSEFKELAEFLDAYSKGRKNPCFSFTFEDIAASIKNEDFQELIKNDKDDF